MNRTKGTIMNEPRTIACTLSEPRLKERVNFISEEILSGASAMVELEDGYEMQFPSDEIWLRKLTDLIAAERKCCTFFQFELILLPNHGPISLRLRGDDGVKEYLQGILAF